MTEAFRIKEEKRLYEMSSYEREYEDLDHLCGIDEAGRGPLAGPVVAAAVILPKNCQIYYLNDSKKLSEKRREELFSEICDKALAYGIGMVSEKVIDEINIRNATMQAMSEAISKLKLTPDMIIVDGDFVPKTSIPARAIPKGDALSISIAAASILAKVTRDRLMREMDEKYPGYGFAKHKGYGTKEHTEAIRALGPCEIHRRSFITRIVEI